MDDIDEMHNCDITDALEHGLTKLKYKVQVLDFDTANILYYKEN